MKLTRSLTAAGLLATGALALSGCGSDNNGTTSSSAAAGGSAAPSSGTTAAKPTCSAGALKGAGSTFQQAFQTQLAASYGQACQAMIDYQGVGSGAGIQQFGTGTIDFAGSDVIMKADEQAAADKRCGGNTAIHLPITAGGIAIIYNLKGVTNLQLDGSALAKIFTGKITTWADPAIAALNPGTTLPSTPIQAVHRSDGSGTTQVLSEYETAAGGADWTLGKGKSLPFPGGQAKKGSDGVTALVGQTDGAITYAEVSFAKQANLPTAKIKSGSSYVAISAASVSSAIAQATASGTAPDIRLAPKYDLADGTSYPISTVSYAIVCTKGTDTAKQTLLKNYLSYVVTTGQTQADGLGFAPLPSSLATRVKGSIDGLS